jgi:hypothetical protein
MQQSIIFFVGKVLLNFWMGGKRPARSAARFTSVVAPLGEHMRPALANGNWRAATAGIVAGRSHQAISGADIALRATRVALSWSDIRCYGRRRANSRSNYRSPCETGRHRFCFRAIECGKRSVPSLTA